jgi:excisionase family DNA binding protein
MSTEILTVSEVAAELRCSRAHVYKAIKGKVAGVSRLPAIPMGRRKLVRRSTLELWKRNNEKGAGGDIISASQEIGTVGRMNGELHA